METRPLCRKISKLILTPHSTLKKIQFLQAFAVRTLINLTWWIACRQQVRKNVCRYLQAKMWVLHTYVMYVLRSYSMVNTPRPVAQQRRVDDCQPPNMFMHKYNLSVFLKVI